MSSSGQRRLVVFRFERSFADVIMRLCRNRTLWKFFQQLAKRIDHPLRVLLFAENQRLLLQGRFAFSRAGIFGQNSVQIGKRSVVVFVSPRRLPRAACKRRAPADYLEMPARNNRRLRRFRECLSAAHSTSPV